MRTNALNLVAAFLLGPTLLALLFAWQAREPGDSEFVFGFWLGFGLPGLALAMFLFWLGRPDGPRRGGDQVARAERPFKELQVRWRGHKSDD